MSRSTRTARKDPLAAFEPATRAWFEGSFERPTEAQAQGWPAIAAGDPRQVSTSDATDIVSPP